MACSPPLKSWGKPHPHLGPDIAILHVAIDHNGDVYFNGKQTSLAYLPVQLDVVPRMGDPEPAVILETEMGAPCDVLDEVRTLMTERLACESEGHCDEGIETVWRDWPLPPGTPPS